MTLFELCVKATTHAIHAELLSADSRSGLPVIRLQTHFLASAQAKAQHWVGASFDALRARRIDAS